MKHEKKIQVDPKIRSGKPCIRGTRIAVEDILELLEAGMTIDDIRVKFYRSLSITDIKACISYARALIHNEEIHIIGKAA